MLTQDQYFLGHSAMEQQRLQKQARELADEARLLFDQLGISAGSRVVEIGCGPLGCLELLSEYVGPTGSVIGIDMSDQAVEAAQRYLAERGVTNVEVRQGDGQTTGLGRGSFDLATARLVLVNVPEPEKIIAEMVALTKPGGLVAFHEADWISHICHPPHPAWHRIVQVLDDYSKANGIDLFIGRRLPEMLRAAGLTNVQVNPLIHIYPTGHNRRTILLDFAKNLRERILAQGLIHQAELDESIASLERHLGDPATLVVSHLFFQAWGQKP